MSRPRESNILVSQSNGTTLVRLTRGQWATIDSSDVPLILQYKWHSRLTHSGWYAYTNHPKGKSLGMHVLLCPSSNGRQADHRDGDGLNNVRSNLRPATHSQNMFNTISRGDGIYFDRSGSGFWRASIMSERGKISRSFRLKKDAMECRLLMEQIVYGDFHKENSL